MHDCRAVEGVPVALSGMSKESNMSSRPLMTLRLFSSSPAQAQLWHSDPWPPLPVHTPHRPSQSCSSHHTERRDPSALSALGL